MFTEKRFLKPFLFFEPILASNHCLFELDHLIRDNLVFLKRFLLGYQLINGQSGTVECFFDLAACPNGSLNMLPDGLRNLKFILLGHLDQRI